MEQKLQSAISAQIQKRIKQLSQGMYVNRQQKFDEVAEKMKRAQHITVLTGAGISTMSGISDYRGGVEGVWRKKPDLLDTLNQQTFLSDPAQFWKSYYDLFAVTLSEILPVETDAAVMTAIEVIEPNEGHRFFAKLEGVGKEVTVLTQNVDGLHQKAGSRLVFEIHGNVTTCSCPICNRSYQLEEIFKAGTVPTCECGGVLRPDVVFFGDSVKMFEEAEEAVEKSDLIVVAGTSLQVSPFNRLPRLAALHNIPIVYINGEEPEDENGFDYVLKGNISEICRLLEEKLEFVDSCKNEEG